MVSLHFIQYRAAKERCEDWILRWITEIETDFVKDDIRCVMEQVSPEGKIIEHIDGRTLNPGHAYASYSACYGEEKSD